MSCGSVLPTGGGRGADGGGAFDITNTKITAISLFFTLLCYYLQWNLFSPIFIMPIFILLGLAYNLVESKVDQN